MQGQRHYESGSYRDRAGRVFIGRAGEILRALSPAAWDEWQHVSSAAFFQRAQQSAQIVPTWEAEFADAPIPDLVAGQPAWAGVLEHKPIPVISYPYEWCCGMLRDAAQLHLELLQAALAEGFVIKDGTAYNIQWVGTQPQFIDVASFERQIAGKPWAGYRQFCQTFLNPLLLQTHRGIPFQPLLRGRLDGISPRDCWRMLGLRDLFRRGILTHVGLHAWLESRPAIDRKQTSQEVQAAGFHHDLIRHNVRGLQRIIERLVWKSPRSHWSGYTLDNQYTTQDHQQKTAFVGQVLQSQHWTQVWDLGCNTGEYARMAAEHADSVIAMDADPACVEMLYQALRQSGGRPAARILPLVQDLADTPGGLGWRGAERRALPERGRPELILCLALLHHLVIGRGIPLPELLAWLAALGADLILEFVTKDDLMVQRLLRGRQDDYWDYETPVFERLLQQHFTVLRSETLPLQTRRLYLARPHRAEQRASVTQVVEHSC